MHGVFKVGMDAADWNLAKIMKVMWQLFRDSSARRGTNTRICESDEFPLKFVLLLF